MSQDDNTTLTSFVGIVAMVTDTMRSKEVKSTRDYNEDTSTTKVTTGTIREIFNQKSDYDDQHRIPRNSSNYG